jgi:chromosome segregation ATPase
MKLISNAEYAALQADLAAARAEANRQRARAEKADARAETEIEARRTITRQHAELDAANTRLTGRNKALGERLAEAQAANGFDPVKARRTAERIATLQKAAAEGREEAAKARAEAKRDRKRVAHLEKELDNACGTPPGGLLDSAPWQPGYQAPTPNTKASTS